MPSGRPITKADEIFDMIHDGINPHTIKILVDHGQYTMQDWDDGIAIAERYDEMEREWKESLPTARERIEQFMESGVSKETVLQARQTYVREVFITSIKSGQVNPRAKAQYQALFNAEVAQDDIDRASQSPISEFATVRNGMTRCPFHEEKTASCHVSNHLYHCFGCGASGNTIHFIRKLKGLGFKEAVRFINAQ